MKNKILLPAFFLLALYSCIERQNFDQYDDLEIVPTIEASILYLESPERLLNEIPGQNFYSQDFNFDGFSVDAFSDRVLDGFIFYEIENTTSKEMEATVEFLDEGGNTIDTQYFHIDPAPTSLLQLQVAYGTGRSIEIIKNTSSIQVSVLNLGDNNSVSNLPDPKIIFRSSGKFRLRLK
ncbi:hypothetical protein QSE00_17685 [Arenibacter sp. M-2]|uniref:hypothetical protein n=1 Tax=unclassified Arenibacter TaxID=2615047 RepID=UPI000D75B618|nr:MULTISPECIES: hypothetical protein [unclassified Arenibacter]MDL5513657.1 hypothetical protein [Arenibacter sp. M-2]PXX25242.1 hypothetical protein C7972_113119 [Arenibacter sp. ARW7G5Y1]|tara:strand:- start:12331 stop:12867 length:537 start_codon:yes stop_codon:yes gene_type:complete